MIQYNDDPIGESCFEIASVKEGSSEVLCCVGIFYVFCLSECPTHLLMNLSIKRNDQTENTQLVQSL
jgi:hypothetical protein